MDASRNIPDESVDVREPDEGIAHYGDPAAEYRTLRESVGIAERRDLGQLQMYGRDPVRMLNGLITNDLLGAGSERAVYGAVLTPKGRIVTDVRVVRSVANPSELLIDVPRSALPGFRDHLTKYVPPMFAKWKDAEMEVLGVYGPRAAESLAAGLGMRADPSEDAASRGTFEDSAVLAIGSAMVGEGGFDLFVHSSVAAELRTALVACAGELGGGPVGVEPLEVARIEAGYPRYGIDFDDRTLPAEVFEGTGAMSRAVSFTKGCYTGQEVVVRIAHRGHVNRLLRGLLLGDAAPPASRTALRHPDSGKEVGWTTSAVQSPRLGQTISLAFVRREIQLGETVAVGDSGTPGVVVDARFSTNVQPE